MHEGYNGSTKPTAAASASNGANGGNGTPAGKGVEPTAEGSASKGEPGSGNDVSPVLRGSAAESSAKDMTVGGYTINMGGLEHVLDDGSTVGDRMLNAPRIIMAACGTSWHSCLIGEYMFEQIAQIPVEVEYASEFRYRKPLIKSNDVIIGISQSGETADTLEALRLAHSCGATTFGLVNVVGSTIARETEAGM